MSASAKVTAGSIVGFLVGLLGAGGYIDPAHSNDITQWIVQIFGGVMAVISLYGYLEHHAQQAKNETTTSVSTTEPVTTVTVPAV